MFIQIKIKFHAAVELDYSGDSEKDTLYVFHHPATLQSTFCTSTTLKQSYELNMFSLSDIRIYILHGYNLTMFKNKVNTITALDIA